MTKATILMGSLVALLSSKALAHYPTLDCVLEQQQVNCAAAYSDGSLAYNETIEVRSYDEELLHSLTTDNMGEIHLAQPAGEYYLIFDPGHEDPAEFDYAEF
ncbi:hypothetical protein MAQ5080_01499 [Marinomonas aquimarina]|uniref:Nickel uptake substrate-specific transmembrane region n=1 Tax=Marinomonas aquimarina TaxID=295068 RepID=A0A1A8TDF5_9GAMM|nr:hypothetical protein [Marinomonas aquimarina]SBS29775.1 hypothetical protein MAQ5080_01499 [Marinomonas aquimarina]